MIPLVCVSVICPDRESCAWGQWKHEFHEIKAAKAAGRSRDCFQPGEVCLAALHQALHCFQGAKKRWTERIATGQTDADLSEAISMEFGTHSGCSMHGGWTAKSNGPEFWSGSDYGRKPDLRGKALVEAVRELLSIPAPKRRYVAPWAGLPLLQMMDERT